MQKRTLWLILCLMVAASFPVGAASLHPQAPFVRLSETGSRPATAMDERGRLYVAWLEQAGPDTLVRLAEVMNEQVGTASTVVSLPGRHAEPRPLALAVTGDKIFLAYNRDFAQVCYQWRMVGGTAWSQPACAPSAEAMNELAKVSIAVLSDGTVVLAWAATRLGIARHRPDGSWQVLPDPGAGDERERTDPRLVWAGDQLVALWVQRRSDGPGNAYRSELLGSALNLRAGTWQQAVSISGFDPAAGQFAVRQPAIAAERSGTLHIAYILWAPGEEYRGPRDQVTYRKGTLAELTTPEALATYGSSPSVSLHGHLVDLAWSAGVGNEVESLPVLNLEIMYSKREHSWRVPTLVSATAGRSYDPQVQVAPDQRSYVVWEDDAGILLSVSSTTGHWRGATPIDPAAIQATTARADQPVAAGRASRSWLWGPEQWTSRSEWYQEAPGAQRTVYYYDKARIEVTDPNRAPSDPAYLTNGLLVTEMASGRMQYGDQLFVGRGPANVVVAGDLRSSIAPTYASFRSLVYIPEIGQNTRSSPRQGLAVDECLDRSGAVTSCRPATTVNYANFIGETGHNIAAPFWSFLNQRGVVFEAGRYREGTVFNWVTTMGFPIAEPYWIKASVAGVERDVLVQLFQRRVLTYTPANPAAFRVEMGNVGQHYFFWRYGATPWVK